jgi:tripartite-type tricarboxylate transporter receptor subunit TctC
MNATRRAFLRATGAALAAPGLARAEAWPDHQIRAVIPFTAGSTADIVGRVVLDPLSRALGQTIVVDNRGGAGGVLGTAVVAKSPADGYTLLVHASAHSAAPAAYPNIPYDTAKDFSAIANFGSIPNVVVVAPGRFKNLAEMVAAAKSGNFTYSSAGVGSATHWAAERVRIAGGFTGAHVPFRGGPEAIMEVAAKRADFACMGMSTALPLVQAGQVQALAVCTPKRSAALPDLPTTIEAGLPDSDYTFWNGLFAPAGTPRAVVDRLHDECLKAIGLPEVQSKFKPLGIEPMPMTPAEFDALIVKEIALNIALVKAAGLKFE